MAYGELNVPRQSVDDPFDACSGFCGWYFRAVELRQELRHF